MNSHQMLISLALVAIAAATHVQFNNRCGNWVQVIRTENGQGPAQQCNLAPGGSCGADFGSNGMNFKNGWNGKTLAEFSFNSWQGQDFYDLSVIVGYDQSMQITTNTGGPTVTCRGAGCPDAYLYPKDDSKTHGTRTGGTFNINFCP